MANGYVDAFALGILKVIVCVQMPIGMTCPCP
jgi:hypothetical protein